MTNQTEGTVFAFSFSQEGFEAVVNLTEIDEQCVMAKLADENPPTSVNNILNMMTMRAQFNEHRRMEVWLAKLDSSFTEQELLTWANKDPQAVADLARMGECLFGDRRKERHVIT